MQIQAAQNTAQPPLILSGTGTSYKKILKCYKFLTIFHFGKGDIWRGDVRPTVEAFQTYKVNWLRSAPPQARFETFNRPPCCGKKYYRRKFFKSMLQTIKITLSDADHQSWYR